MFVYGRCVPQVVEWMGLWLEAGWVYLLAKYPWGLHKAPNCSGCCGVGVWTINGYPSRQAGDTIILRQGHDRLVKHFKWTKKLHLNDDPYCYTIYNGLIENQNEVASVQLFHDRKAWTLLQWWITTLTTQEFELPAQTRERSREKLQIEIRWQIEPVNRILGRSVFSGSVSFGLRGVTWLFFVQHASKSSLISSSSKRESAIPGTKAVWCRLVRWRKRERANLHSKRRRSKQKEH